LDTLPKFNIAPENGWLEYYFPFGMVIFPSGGYWFLWIFETVDLTIATHGRRPPFAKVSRSSGKEMDVVVKHISKSKKTATGFFLTKKPLEIGGLETKNPGN